MSRLTVKDIGGYRRPNPKRRGARIDFRWSVKTSHEERERLLSDFLTLIRNEELVMSGFGEESYSGIISSVQSLTALKKKLLKLTEWKNEYSDKFNLFRTGKVQWVEDIYFE